MSPPRTTNFESANNHFNSNFAQASMLRRPSLPHIDEVIPQDSNPANYSDRSDYLSVLEIQVDELESENYALRSRLKLLEAENDSVIERNVLLQHELADVRQGTKPSIETPKADSLINVSNPPNRTCSTHSSRSSNALKVSSNQNSLRVSPRNARADTSATHLSSTSVVSTTSYK